MALHCAPVMAEINVRQEQQSQLSHLCLGELSRIDLTEEEIPNLFMPDAALSSRFSRLARKPAGRCQGDLCFA